MQAAIFYLFAFDIVGVAHPEIVGQVVIVKIVIHPYRDALGRVFEKRIAYRGQFRVGEDYLFELFASCEERRAEGGDGGRKSDLLR